MSQTATRFLTTPPCDFKCLKTVTCVAEYGRSGGTSDGELGRLREIPVQNQLPVHDGNLHVEETKASMRYVLAGFFTRTPPLPELVSFARVARTLAELWKGGGSRGQPGCENSNRLRLRWERNYMPRNMNLAHPASSPLPCKVYL